jgi:predicted DNA-binding WGR domain protein
MDWEIPPPDFRFILFDRVDPAKNECRFYYLAWSRTLLDQGAVVRLYGRKGRSQHMISPQRFSSLEEAWPLIRTIIKTRLRHGYQIVEPTDYRS